MIMLIASILATFPWAVQDMHDGKTGLAPVEYRSRGPHSFDVLHYDVALDLYPEAESLVGVVGILFESDKLGLDQITLDLFALGVDSAWDSTGPLAFTQSDSTVDLELSSPLAPGASTTVWVAFSGQPAHSTWAGFFWNVHFGPCLTHITLGMEPASGRWVFPCWDDIYDKASIDTHITVADSLFAASCGGLTGVESIGGRSTYNWSHPQEISLYIWALAVSDFNVVDDTTYPWIKYYVQEELTGYVEQIFGNVDLMMDCFEDVYCGYPWGQNLGFPFVTANGILCEHNTLPFTVINYESYVAHELSHHWWGNLVTEEDWPEIWLSEGLASYSQAAWEEWQYGEDSYHDFMLETMQYYLGTGELIPIVPAEDYWSATVYDKGSCVVHMLRHVVGDDSFWAALQSYLVDNAYGSTTTEDFVASFEAESTEATWAGSSIPGSMDRATLTTS